MCICPEIVSKWLILCIIWASTPAGYNNDDWAGLMIDSSQKFRSLHLQWFTLTPNPALQRSTIIPCQWNFVKKVVNNRCIEKIIVLVCCGQCTWTTKIRCMGVAILFVVSVVPGKWAILLRSGRPTCHLKTTIKARILHHKDEDTSYVSNRDTGAVNYTHCVIETSSHL